MRAGGRSGKDLWRYKILARPSKAIRTKGGFSTHRNEVEQLVDIAQELIRHRSAITGYIGDLGRGWTQKERHLSDRNGDVVASLLGIVDSINAKGAISLDADQVLN